jgi:hypothetical protein
MDWYQYVEDCGKASRDLEYSQQAGSTCRNIVAKERLGRFSNSNDLTPGSGDNEIDSGAFHPRTVRKGGKIKCTIRQCLPSRLPHHLRLLHAKSGGPAVDEKRRD